MSQVLAMLTLGQVILPDELVLPEVRQLPPRLRQRGAFSRKILAARTSLRSMIQEQPKPGLKGGHGLGVCQEFIC